MQALNQALYTKLNSDATLTADLDTYRSVPAIFSGGITPKDFELTRSSDKAYILINPPIASNDIGPKSHELLQITQDIIITSRTRTSLAFIESVAERVRTLLNRSSLTVTGYSFLMSDVSGPISLGQLEDQLTYAVTITTTLKPN